MGKLLVLLTAVIFFAYGLIFVFFPVQALLLVVGGSVSSSSGVIDVRATYGGMSVGVGIVLYLLATTHGALRIGLISVCLLMLGMAAGRIIGMVLDGNPNMYMYIYLVLELSVSSLAVFFLRSNGVK
jgi:hypothetical protein